MKDFLKENWLKISLLLLTAIAVLSLVGYLNEKRAIEEKILSDQRVAELKRHVEEQCITDAYTELKNLQSNYDSISMYTCIANKPLCDVDFWNKAKDKSFETYQNEWVPQCKLGNRVFIHYERQSVNDMMNAASSKQ